LSPLNKKDIFVCTTEFNFGESYSGIRWICFFRYYIWANFQSSGNLLSFNDSLNSIESGNENFVYMFYHIVDFIFDFSIFWSAYWFLLCKYFFLFYYFFVFVSLVLDLSMVCHLAVQLRLGKVYFSQIYCWFFSETDVFFFYIL